MSSTVFLQVLANFGGLGVLAVFAWFLVRSVVRQNEKLTDVLQNHMHQNIAIQTEIRDCLGELVKEVRSHNEKAGLRHEEQRGWHKE